MKLKTSRLRVSTPIGREYHLESTTHSQSELVINQYHDFWMDNAIENLYSLVVAVHETDPSLVSVQLYEDKLSINVIKAKEFLRAIAELIKSKRDSVLFSESSIEGKPKKNIRLGYILLQYGKSSHGKNSVKEKIYNDDQMHSRLSDGFLPKTGKLNCVLCGSSFARRIDNLKQSVLPSVTKNAALSGVLSKDEYFHNVCPTCYMLGSLEWIDEGIIYRSQQNGESIALYPIGLDLLSLSKEKKLARQRLSTRTLYSNLTERSDGKDVRIYGPYSGLLLFLESIVESLTRRDGTLFDPNSAKLFLLGKWMCLRVPSGNVKNVRMEPIELPDQVIQTVRTVDDASQPDVQALGIYRDLLYSLRCESDRQRTSLKLGQEIGELRERLARHFLQNDFHSFSSEFVPRKGVNIYMEHKKWSLLDRFLMKWQLNETGITPEDLSQVKQAANLVAELNLGNISVFYAIERARSATEFINALQEASRRLVIRAEDFATGEMIVNPMSLDSLLQLVVNSPAKWQVLKDTLLIFTAMYYAIKRRKTNVE
jgi:hypothetical protein